MGSLSVEDMLKQGYVKVGSKSYCTYWKKGNDIVTVQDLGYKDEIYIKGAEDSLNAVKSNLEHFLKGVCCVEMTYDGCSMYRHEGWSECEKLLKENILGNKL